MQDVSASVFHVNHTRCMQIFLCPFILQLHKMNSQNSHQPTLGSAVVSVKVPDFKRTLKYPYGGLRDYGIYLNKQC